MSAGGCGSSTGGLRVPAPAALALASLLAATALVPAIAAARDAKSPRVLRPEHIVFAGIPWRTSADSAGTALGADGYTPVGEPRGHKGPADPSASGEMICKGKLFGHMAMVRGDLDEQGRVARWTVSIAPDLESGYVYGTMRKVYDDVVTEMNSKYGRRTGWAERFDFPFERGDGLEDKALRDGKATIHSVWDSLAGDRLTVAMDRSDSVVLTYECPAWAALVARARAKKARDL